MYSGTGFAYSSLLEALTLEHTPSLLARPYKNCFLTNYNMKSKTASRILANTPAEKKRFIRKYTDIVLRVQELMAKQGLTQKDLAEKLEKQPSEISRWLSGEHNLTLKSICKLEEELGADILIVPKQEQKNEDLRMKIPVMPSAVPIENIKTRNHRVQQQLALPSPSNPLFLCQQA